MHNRKGSSKECMKKRKSSIPRDIKKRSSYRGLSAAHSRTNNSSFSSAVNASWACHFDDDASCCNHSKDQTIDRRERKEQPFNKSPTRSIDDNPYMPKKNLLLENDLELKALMQQLHESTEFMGTINPLCHSHCLSPNKVPKLKEESNKLLKAEKCSSRGLEGHTTTVGAATKRNRWLAFNAVLDEHMIEWDWGILLRRRRIATTILLATTANMMHYGMMKKSPHKSKLANRNIEDDDARCWR
jgi:hypothetical protein